MDRLRTLILWEGLAVSAAVAALCTHLAGTGRTGLCAVLAFPAVALAWASLAGLSKRPRR